jgi:hypothetical protein
MGNKYNSETDWYILFRVTGNKHNLETCGRRQIQLGNTLVNINFLHTNYFLWRETNITRTLFSVWRESNITRKHVAGNKYNLETYNFLHTNYFLRLETNTTWKHTCKYFPDKYTLESSCIYYSLWRETNISLVYIISCDGNQLRLLYMLFPVAGIKNNSESPKSGSGITLTWVTGTWALTPDWVTNTTQNHLVYIISGDGKQI